MKGQRRFGRRRILQDPGRQHGLGPGEALLIRLEHKAHCALKLRLVLLQQRGIAPEQVDGVYLAGGFGSYLDPESAMAIGMLPRACAGKLHTLGNTALAGAAALTLDPAQWQRIGNISRACDYLELSGRADFAAAFTDDLSFPQP